MSFFLALLITSLAVYAVLRPLTGGYRCDWELPVPATGQSVTICGVWYESKEEWAIDRLLGKAIEGDAQSETPAGPGYSAAQLADQVERQVACLRREREKARKRSHRIVCAVCGKTFHPGDRFCAQCGTPHPKTCPSCGQRYKQGDVFCTACGVLLLAEKC